MDKCNRPLSLAFKASRFFLCRSFRAARLSCVSCCSSGVWIVGELAVVSSSGGAKRVKISDVQFPLSQAKEPWNLNVSMILGIPFACSRCGCGQRRSCSSGIEVCRASFLQSRPLYLTGASLQFGVAVFQVCSRAYALHVVSPQGLEAGSGFVIVVSMERRFCV